MTDGDGGDGSDGRGDAAADPAATDRGYRLVADVLGEVNGFIDALDAGGGGGEDAGAPAAAPRRTVGAGGDDDDVSRGRILWRSLALK